MRINLFLSLLIFNFSVAGCQSLKEKDNKLKIIKSTSAHILYNINGNQRGWRILPNVNPDIVKFECVNKINRVSFVTDVDSINFDVKVNDSIVFAILLNHDTAFTQIIGLPKNANFTDDYKTKNEGKISVSIPEVSELANIIMAISDIGLKDSNMINMKGFYYKEVLNWFSKYKNETIIKNINSQTAKNDNSENYSLYYSLKMNACGYYFLKNEIFQDSSILKMGFDNYPNQINLNLKFIQDFAQKSNFRQFYSDHQLYYDSLIERYHEIMPVPQMKEWLESEFPNKRDYYIITFSPLVHGAHSTNWFYDNNFSVSAMFVAQIFYDSTETPTLNEIYNSRLLFTEIDHDYVNPISDHYLDEINYVFKDRMKWAAKTKTGFYPSAYEVFNEYMTWAVFTLYCYDHYTEPNLKKSMKKIEKFMEERRGFTRYAAFDHALLEIYKKEKGKKKASELYPELIDWCSSQ